MCSSKQKQEKQAKIIIVKIFYVTGLILLTTGVSFCMQWCVVGFLSVMIHK